VLAADEVREPPAAHRFEAAFGQRDILECPSLDRLTKAFQLVPAERAELEAVAEQPARTR
jgi:hypothetical protein